MKNLLKLFLLVSTIMPINPLQAQDGNKGICNVNLEGQEFMIHVVDLGETLYSISKKYSASMGDIWKYNPTIIDSVIIPGQILKIPFNEKTYNKPVIKPTIKPVTVATNIKPAVTKSPTPETKPVVIAPKTTTTTTAIAPALQPKQKFDSTKIVYHLVEKGQTLYSISRTYNQSVEKISEWNDLGETPNIQLGQKLIVSPFGAIKVIDEKKVVTEIKPSNTPVKTKVPLNEQQDFLFDEFSKQKKSATGPLKSERGSSTWLETGSPMMKSNYFCLSKTAPIGTIVKVTNLVNQKYVLLKVIGKLPNTQENEEILLRISPAAKQDGVFFEGKNFTQIDFYN